MTISIEPKISTSSVTTNSSNTSATTMLATTSSRHPSQNNSTIKRPKACTNCRRSKVKCIKDDNDETCNRCKSQGLSCVYEYKVASYKVASRNDRLNGGTPIMPQSQIKSQSHSPVRTVIQPQGGNKAIGMGIGTEEVHPLATQAKRIVPQIKNIINAEDVDSNTGNGGRYGNSVYTSTSTAMISAPVSSQTSVAAPHAADKGKNLDNWEKSVEDRLGGFGNQLDTILILLKGQSQATTPTHPDPNLHGVNSGKRRLEDVDNDVGNSTGYPQKLQKIINTLSPNSSQVSTPTPRLTSNTSETDYFGSAANSHVNENEDQASLLRSILSREDAEELFSFFNSNISPQLFGFDISKYSIDTIWETCPLLIATISCIASIHHHSLSNLAPSLEKIIYNLSREIIYKMPQNDIEAFNTIMALCFCGFWFGNNQMFTGVAVQIARSMNLVSPMNKRSKIPKADRLKLWYLLYILDGQQSLVFNTQSMIDPRDSAIVNSKETLISAENEDIKQKQIQASDGQQKTETLTCMNADNSIKDSIKFNTNYADIRLISQVEYHQAINAAFDGSAWGLLTPASFGLPFKTNLELDKWMVQWTVLLSPFKNNPVWSSKSTLIYYNFAKMHINSSAVRNYHATGMSLPKFDEIGNDFLNAETETDHIQSSKITTIDSDEDDEDDDDEDAMALIAREMSPLESKKVSAQLALSAAETVLNVVLDDPDILNVLKYVPVHIHIMLYYSAILILKPHTITGIEDENDQESKFNSAINAIKLVKRLRHSIIVNTPTDKEFSTKMVRELTNLIRDKVSEMKLVIENHDYEDEATKTARLVSLDKVLFDNDIRELVPGLRRTNKVKISAWPGFDAGHPTKTMAKLPQSKRD